MKVVRIITAGLAVASLCLASCQSMSPQTQRRVGKAATGAVVGGLVGELTGKKGGGGFKSGALSGAAASVVSDMMFNGNNSGQQWRPNYRNQNNQRNQVRLPKAPRGMHWVSDGQGGYSLCPNR